MDLKGVLKKLGKEVANDKTVKKEAIKLSSYSGKAKVKNPIPNINATRTAVKEEIQSNMKNLNFKDSESLARKKYSKFYESESKFKQRQTDFRNKVKDTGLTKDGKFSNMLQKAIPTAIGGGLVFSMFNRSGQMNNAELYGQQRPYGY